MHVNRKAALAVVTLILTAGALSACKDSDSAPRGGGDLNYYPPANTIGKNTLNDGVDRSDRADTLQAVGDRVFFNLDRSDLTPESKERLSHWVGFLQSHPNDRLVIEGHSDERGTREYNLALGARRASAVEAFLVAGGIPASRIQTVSYGKERPAVLGSNEAAYAQNRRAVGVVQ